MSLGSSDLRVNYRWIESIRPDGKARNLRFTEISGPIVESQPESLQPLFVASVKRVLNKITVRTLAGGKKLGYATPLGGESTVRFRPARGLLNDPRPETLARTADRVHACARSAARARAVERASCRHAQQRRFRQRDQSLDVLRPCVGCLVVALRCCISCS